MLVPVLVGISICAEDRQSIPTEESMERNELVAKDSCTGVFAICVPFRVCVNVRVSYAVKGSLYYFYE